MHHRIYLSPEDRKFVDRWRLVVMSIYSSLAFIVILLATFHSVKDGATVEAPMRSTGFVHPVNVKR